MTDPMVEDYLTYLTSKHYSPVSVKHRRRVLYLICRLLPEGFDKIEPDDLDRVIWRSDLAPWSRHTYYSAAHSLCSWAARVGWLNYDPTEDIPVPPCGHKRPRPLRPDQITDILAITEDPFRTGVVLASGAGLRASEMAKVDREDVTEQDLHVRFGKGGKPRYVSTTRFVWLHVKDRPPGPLLRHPRTGLGVSGDWLTSKQHHIWTKLGLPDVHWHRFRASFATILAEEGVPPSAIAEEMGHAGLGSLGHYIAVTESMRNRARTAIDGALNGPASL